MPADNLETTRLPRVATPEEGMDLLLSEMRAWFDEAEPRHRDRPWNGGHDEGTFLTSWADYVRLTGDPRVEVLAFRLFESAAAWCAANFLHGYHKKQEAHHGPEHFVIFLDWLRALRPGDARVSAAIEDAAHHLGNWIEGIPRWFDWDRNRFVSAWLGTEQVGDEGSNITDHLRLARLALQAWEATGNRRYLDFALRYAGDWASRIVTGPGVPVMLDEDAGTAERYGALRAKFLRAAPDARSNLDRIESHVANGVPELFMALHEASGSDVFSEAARRLVLPLIPELADPCAAPAGMLLSRYREVLGDFSRDEAIVAAVGPAPDPERLAGLRLAIDPQPVWEALTGLGKRRDMPVWLIDDGSGDQPPCQLPATSALMLGFEITTDPAYAMAAEMLAVARLRLARQVYPDGREHGCSARSVAAVARGHGRNWGAGDVSGVLGSPAAARLAGR